MEIGTKVKMKINEGVKDKRFFSNRVYVIGIKKDKRMGNTKYNRIVGLDIERRTEKVGIVINKFNEYDNEFVTIQFLQYMDRKYGLEFMLDKGEWVLNPYKSKYINEDGTLIEYDKNEEIRDYENLIKRHNNKIDSLNEDIHSWLVEIKKISKEMD